MEYHSIYFHWILNPPKECVAKNGTEKHGESLKVLKFIENVKWKNGYSWNMTKKGFILA